MLTRVGSFACSQLSGNPQTAGIVLFGALTSPERLFGNCSHPSVHSLLGASELHKRKVLKTVMKKNGSRLAPRMSALPSACAQGIFAPPLPTCLSLTFSKPLFLTSWSFSCLDLSVRKVRLFAYHEDFFFLDLWECFSLFLPVAMCSWPCVLSSLMSATRVQTPLLHGALEDCSDHGCDGNG